MSDSQSKVFLFDGSDPEMLRAHENARANFRYFWRELHWERRRIIPGLDLASVKAAIALGIPHPTLGEMVVLCVVPTAGNRIDEEALRARLRERLAAYKVPRQILVVAEGDVPVTGTQKFRTDALRALALERLPRRSTS